MMNDKQAGGIERITVAQERRIIRGIEKAIAGTRAGATPDEALAKAAGELGLTPELTKRACEAFNKSKTVHMLSNTPAERRAEPFDHADPVKVLGKVFGPALAKTAAEPPGLVFKDCSAMGLTPAPRLQKVACETAAAPAPDIFKEGSEIDYRRDLRDRMRALDEFDRQRSLVNQLRLQAEDCIAKAAGHMRYMKHAEMAKIAHVVVNRFGGAGAALVRVLGAKLRAELPLEKTAHGAVLPLGSPYPELDEAVRCAREHCRQHARLVKMAEDTAELMGLKKKYLTKDAADQNKQNSANTALREALDAARANQASAQGTPLNPAPAPPEEQLATQLAQTPAPDGAADAEAEEAKKAKDKSSVAEAAAQLGESTANLLGWPIGLGMGAATGAATAGLQTLHDQTLLWRELLADQGSPRPIDDELLSPAFRGQLAHVDQLRNWSEVASDPAVSRYPLQDITSAYNNIINVVPQFRSVRMLPAVKAMVRRQLAQSQLMDPAEIVQLAALGKSLADTGLAEARGESERRSARPTHEMTPKEDLLKIPAPAAFTGDSSKAYREWLKGDDEDKKNKGKGKNKDGGKGGSRPGREPTEETAGSQTATL